MVNEKVHHALGGVIDTKANEHHVWRLEGFD